MGLLGAIWDTVCAAKDKAEAWRAECRAMQDRELLRVWRRAAGWRRLVCDAVIRERLREMEEGEEHPDLAWEADRIRMACEGLDDRALARKYLSLRGWEAVVCGEVIRRRCEEQPWGHEALIDFAERHHISF